MSDDRKPLAELGAKLSVSVSDGRTLSVDAAIREFGSAVVAAALVDAAARGVAEAHDYLLEAMMRTVDAMFARRRKPLASAAGG